MTNAPPSGVVPAPAISPLAEAIESFLLDLKRTTQVTNSIFYREVLSKAYSIGAPGHALEESQDAAQDLAAFVEDLARQRRESRTLRLASRVRPLIEGLGQFTAACDVMVQASSKPGMVLYGGAKLVLQLAQSLYACRDAIDNILAEMGSLLQGYHIFSSAHKNSPEMRDALVSAYKNIVKFWHKLSELLDKKTYKITAFAAIKPLNKEWDACQKQLERDRFTVLNLNQALQAKLLMERKLETDTQKQAQLKSRIVEWIKGGEDDQNLYCQSFIRECADKRYPETCNWLFAHTEFETWLAARKSSFLLLLAPPGAGKTILASATIQMLQSHDRKTVAFFCISSDPAKSKTITVLRALAIKLLFLNKHAPDSVQRLFKSDDDNFCNNMIDIGTAIEVLKGLIQQIDRVHIILDGLDECSDQSILLHALQSISNAQTHGIVKWLFTARPEPEIRAALLKLGSKELMVPQDSLMVDIRSFMKGSLKKPKCDEYIDSMVSRSEGNFLVAFLTLQTLNGMGLTCEEDVEEELAKFPRDLRGCYIRSLEHLAKRSQAQQNLARNLFAFLLAAAQPLRLSELLHALAASRPAEDFSTKRLSDALLIEELSSNLIIFDKSDKGTAQDPLLRFFHKSVQDFFQQSPEILNAPENIRTLFTSREFAHLELGKACVQYLSYKRYGRPANAQKLLKDDKHAFLRYAATYWHRHLGSTLPCSEISDQVQKFVKSEMFWNCISVQSHVAPHLHTRFEQHRQHMSYGYSVPSDPRSEIRAYYASPLPPWMQQVHPTVVEDLHSFIMQWHHVLNFSPENLGECRMDDSWSSRWPRRQVWESKRVDCWTLNPHSSTLDDHLAGVTGFDRFRQRSPNSQQAGVPDRSGEDARPEDLGSAPTASTRVYADGQEMLHCLDPISDSAQSGIDNAVVCADSAYAEDSVARPGGTGSWHAVGVFPNQYRFHESPIVAVQWIAESDPNKEEKSDCGIDISDSESDHLSSDETDDDSTSAEDDSWSSETESDTSSSSPISTLSSQQKQLSSVNCLVIPRKEGKPIQYIWKSDQSHVIARGSAHPTKPLVFWSPSLCQFCVVDLSASDRRIQSAYLPEPDMSLGVDPGSFMHKEFYYSQDTDELFYLLLAAKQGTFGIEMKLSVSFLRWTTTEDGLTELHQNGQAAQIEYEATGGIQLPYILTAWTEQYVLIVLPQLAYKPKIVRLALSKKGSCGDRTTPIFETLRKPIFFPFSAPERGPQLHYSTPENASNVLTMSLAGDKVVQKGGDGTAVRQPPTIMTWKIDDDKDWRAWESDLDKTSEDEEEAKQRVRRLRGTYVDQDKRFHVPVRSGLDWRKRAHLSCY